MLKILSIKNLVLIEACEIEFQKGLNILSGETGAGKTALTEAISLVVGARADSSCIRHGAEKATVEAAFDIEEEFLVHAALQEAQIEFDPNEFLVLRREISKQGRSRALINCHMVPVQLLQKIGALLVDLIGQHSHQELRTMEAQRSLLDLFCCTQEDLHLFHRAWDKEKEMETALAKLLEEASKRERVLETLLRERQELEDAAIQEEEEKLLFEEYNRLAHAQEITEKCTLARDRIADIPSVLIHSKQLCDQLATMDYSFQESATLLQDAMVGVKETYHTLSNYLGHLESDPGRFAYLEERLKVIDRMKRKYGNPIRYLEEILDRCFHLDNLDEEIETAREHLKCASQCATQCAEKLTVKRTKGAKKWEEMLNLALRSLNMPHAQLNIVLEKQSRTLSGEDAIHFWLSANSGEKAVPVKENASGGELSRLLFAIKTTLAKKNNTPTLIFDEIDANVGGQTATLIGQKLQELGTCRQVLCITHFAQVASYADHHLSVHKEEIEGRTFAFISSLDASSREKELSRMLGHAFDKTADSR